MNKHSKKSAGKLGGLATFQKYGREYMREIGRRGAEATWSRYYITPYGTSKYAMVCKKTERLVAIF